MDLNLLVGLNALLEARSVQGAAAQLDLTPSALSQLLSRLRTATGDEILVRDGRRMVPTPRALRMHDEVRDVVARAKQILTPQRELDLQTLDHTFVVRCHKDLVATAAVKLVAVAAAEAPHVRFEIVTDDDSVDRGRADLEIGDVPSPSPPWTTTVVTTDRMMLVVRRGGSLDVPNPTVLDVAAAAYVAVSHRGRQYDSVDDRLGDLELTRQIAATVPTAAAAIEVVNATEYATLLPARLTYDLPSTLVAREMPFVLTSAPVAISWHCRHDTDPAHQWIRGIAQASFA